MQGTVDDTVQRYDAARARLAVVQADVSATSARLDTLVARQDELQGRLGIRAAGMYRTGPLGFVEVLAHSASFDEFSNTWDFLARIGRHDALTVRDLKRSRAEVASAAKELLAKQASVSAQLRALDAEKAQAQGKLSQSKASYISYTRRIADLEGQEAARAAREKAQREQAERSRPAPRARADAPHGSGSWQSAVCSMYGPDDIGSPMAGGGRVGADSMIVAHKTLPFGTLVEFSFHGNTGVATVADRGPYVDGREFDLGPGIARVLGFDGVATVRYRIIGR